MSIIVVLLGLCILFLPIFKSPLLYKNDPKDADLEYLSLLLEDALKGKSKKSFSEANEMGLIFKQMGKDGVDMRFGDLFKTSIGAYWVMILLTLATIASGTYGIVKSSMALANIEETRLKRHKNHEKFPEHPIVNPYGFFEFALVIVFVLIDGFTSMGSDLVVRRLPRGDLFALNVSRFAWPFLIVLLLAIAYVVVNIKTRMLDSVIKAQIPIRRKARKAENRRQNEASQRKNLEKKMAAAQSVATAPTQPKEGSTSPEQTSNKPITPPAAEQTSRTHAVASPIEEIKQYKELLDSGIITEEEFNTKKKQLMGL